MKKLMIAAAAAAMVSGAYATACVDDTSYDVARVYQVQFNVYTTKGVAQGGIGATQCVDGDCLVMRGRDKTVFRGYVYICEDLCELKEYKAVFADVKRVALFGEKGEVTWSWNFANVIGANSTDAECAWDFAGTVTYDATRMQEYALKGAGYGEFAHSTEGFFKSFAGYFAGTASASYDLSSKAAGDIPSACICEPSQVLTCDNVAGMKFTDSDTVAFGTWKMKFNANLSKAYLAGKWNPNAAAYKLIKKMFKPET